VSPARLTGASVRRVEDPRLLTGQATFTADVRSPDQLHAVFVRSPHPHATIRRIDTGAARRAAGVHAVLTDGDLETVLAPLQPTSFPELLPIVHTALASDAVRYVGDPVVLVIAESSAAAEDAAELVEVDYEPLPAVSSAEAGRVRDAPVLWPAVGSNVVHRQHRTVGDPAGALEAADVVVRTRIAQHRVANAPMECRAVVAEHDPTTGALTVTASHQSPNQLRTLLAAALGLGIERVRVVCPSVGGSFGQKSGMAREDAALAAAAIRLGRAVVWHETRTENLLAAGHAREAFADVDAGFAADGRLLGLRVHLVVDLGAHPQVGYPAPGYANLVRALLPAAYRLEHYEFSAELVATNKAMYVPYRGPWEMETFVRERVLDLAARRLAIDPVELRRRNLMDADELARGSCVGVDLRGVTVADTLARASALLAEADWAGEVAAGRAAGRRLGIGLSTYVEPAPVSPSLLAAMGMAAVSRSPQTMRLRLERDGAVTLVTSQQPHGQGHETTLAQLTADRLGVPMESVRVVWGDTDVVPFNLVGTGGSRAATLASGAVLAAADAMAERLRDLAAARLEIAPHDLELRDGMVVPRDAPSRGVALVDLARDDDPPEVVGEYLSGEGTWSQATHCALVEVDADTGRVVVLRYLVVEDCGPPINPAVVDGQVRGGVVQGIAAVLHEHVVYDDDAQPRAATFLDYLVPSAVEAPEIEIHHLHSLTDDPVPYRGVGEGGAIGSPAALVSAVGDALADLGLELTEQHLPPARLVEHLTARRGPIRDRGPGR
jgi:carbon-monoxide dehydrogenase large subunit